MAVRWISDAARELGIAPLDAVELLALHQNYPMNGLLDEDRVHLLRRYAQERKLVESSGKKTAGGGSGPRPVPPPPPPPKGDAMAATSVTAVTAVTAPMESHPDKSEDRTVIIPPPHPNG